MTRTRWRIVLWLGVLFVAVYLVWAARGALLPFAVGGVAALALSPLVDRLASVIPARSHRGDVYRRGAAVVVIYVVIGLFLFAAGAALIPIAADQVAVFVEELPATIEAAREEVLVLLENYRATVRLDVQEWFDEAASEAGEDLATAVAATARAWLTAITGTIPVIFGFIIVPFWMFYAIRDRHFVHRNLLNAVPGGYAQDVEHVLAMADRLVSRYIRAQLIYALAVGIAVGFVMTWMGVPLSVALALFAGVTELIPLLGPWIGVAPALIIIAASEPSMTPWVALAFGGIQLAKHLVLVRHMRGQTLQLHPAMVIMLLAVGAAAFGFLGLLFIVPLAAILRELFWYADRRFRGMAAAEAYAFSMAGRWDAERAARQPPSKGPPPGDEPATAQPDTAPGRPAASDAPVRAGLDEAEREAGPPARSAST